MNVSYHLLFITFYYFPSILDFKLVIPFACKFADTKSPKYQVAINSKINIVLSEFSSYMPRASSINKNVYIFQEYENLSTWTAIYYYANNKRVVGM